MAVHLGLKARFYSDVNLDSFVQSVAQLGLESDVDLATRVVLVEDTEEARELVSDWGGLLEDA